MHSSKIVANSIGFAMARPIRLIIVVLLFFRSVVAARCVADEGVVSAREEKANAAINGLRFVERHKNGALKSLIMRGSTDQQVEEIDFAAFSQLEHLTLMSAFISDRSLKHLESINVKLKVLRVGGGAKFTDSGVMRLLKHQNSLKHLDLFYVPITNKCLTAISECIEIRTLSLAGTNVTGIGLSRFRRLRELYSLDLGDTPLSDDGMQELGTLPSLAIISLKGTPVTDDGLRHLAKMKSLFSVRLTATNTTEQAEQFLRECFPTLRIYKD